MQVQKQWWSIITNFLLIGAYCRTALHVCPPTASRWGTNGQWWSSENHEHGLTFARALGTPGKLPLSSFYQRYSYVDKD